MEGETSTRVLDFLNKLLILELPSFAYSLCFFLISRLDSELSKLVRYKAFVSLMKCAAIKCYSPYFTPERFYSIGKTLEEIKDIDLAKRVVSKSRRLITAAASSGSTFDMNSPLSCLIPFPSAQPLRAR